MTLPAARSHNCSSHHRENNSKTISVHPQHSGCKWRREREQYLHSAVTGAGNNLRIGGLRFHGPHGTLVARENVDLVLGPHVPHLRATPHPQDIRLVIGMPQLCPINQRNSQHTYSGDGISPSSHQHIERWMDLQRKHTRQVAVVASDHFVVLQIPT